MSKISARHINGLIVIKGLTQEDYQQRPVCQHFDNKVENVAAHIHASIKNVPSVALSFVDSTESTSDSPNQRGTYSREYTLKHPEINWVHRGQGRYLPEDLIPSNTQSTSNSSQEHSDPQLPDQRNLRHSIRVRSGHSSEKEDHELVSPKTRHQSPHVTRSPDTTYSLRRRQLDQAPVTSTTTNELREARLLRRTNSFMKSVAQAEIEAAHEDDIDKTYSRTYVEAHPEIQFRHCGNGFYKRILMPKICLDTRSTRNLRRSSAKTGYYRRESATSQDTSPSSTAETGSSESSAVDEPNNMDSFTKEQMLDYKLRHPDIVFIHRGNGRYKRINDVVTEATNVTASFPQEKLTYSKEYVEKHSGEEFYHCGCGRYKRGPRTDRASIISSNSNGEEIPSGLVTKDYVDSHPRLLFHHRGQGRYALGPRPHGLGNEHSQDTPIAATKDTKDILYDGNYVDAHAHETFHHRGQGRWARGLPPPGSSNKTAVRGPGSQHGRVSSVAGKPSGNGSELPGVHVLVSKADGPEAWPGHEWRYRGGNKWSRVPRGDTASKQKPQRAGRTSKALQFDTAQEQLVQDLLADVDSNASNSRRGSLQAAPALKRKRSILQSLEWDETNRSEHQSKASTPVVRILTLDEDHLSDDDLPDLYREEWSPIAAEESNDEAAQLLRTAYRPLNDVDAFIKSMTKYSPAIRPLENLHKIAAHVQDAMRQMQDEYLELDKITAPHARIPRRVATGGRLPVDVQTFEDKKEADLYDYQFDSRRIGYQDPDGQKISRDVDGRELRKRRKRGDLDADAVTASEEVVLPRRTIKPVNKFDGVPGSTTRRSRLADKQGSISPDRATTPSKARTTNVLAQTYVAPSSGRWANHIPKRIRELRGGSTAMSEADGGSSIDEDDSADEQPAVDSGSQVAVDLPMPFKVIQAPVIHSIEGDHDEVMSGTSMDEQA